MSSSDAQRTVEEYLDAYNARDMGRIESLWADEIQSVGGPLNREDLLSAIEAYWKAFPDCEIREERYISSGEYVAVHITFTGTHENDYYGFEPTGNEFDVVEMMTFQVNHGEINGYWYAWDELGFWEQLGVLEHPLH